ncbi:MAG: hypothetical protein HKP51_04725 [Sulfitobacter sp.]|nr:hypothetical protein [Sulfitobacter sp.]
MRSLPSGTCTGHAAGKRYVTTLSQFSAGRAIKLVAEELGGQDYISLNLYDLTSGPQLYPCEMPSAKVIAFVRDFIADESDEQ